MLSECGVQFHSPLVSDRGFLNSFIVDCCSFCLQQLDQNCHFTKHVNSNACQFTYSRFTSVQLLCFVCLYRGLECDWFVLFACTEDCSVTGLFVCWHRGLQLHRGVERIDNTVSVPESWADFTDGNIKRSQAERANSRNMRNDVVNMLNHVSDQLWKQWNKVSGLIAHENYYR